MEDPRSNPRIVDEFEFPNLDPTHPNGPRRLAPLADEEIAAYHRAGELPPPGPYEAASVASPSSETRQLPRTPAWVADPAKWATLSRAERRALERHHRKQTRHGA